jgi:hypothetical protein
MTSSINISSSNISGKCDLKCVYNFNYPNTNVIAENAGSSITLKFDSTTQPSVTYNNKQYNPSVAVIVTPSANIFNGNTTNAEIIIVHTPTLGGAPLFVAIPIVSSSNSSNATDYITEIIQNVSTNAPKQGSSTTINNSDFTLNSIVPKKPFYTYTITGTDEMVVVYDMEYAIPLSSSILSTLSSLIQPCPFGQMFGSSSQLFFNSSGPNSTGNSEGIYIKCNPTGSSSETTQVEYSKDAVTSGTNFNGYSSLKGNIDFRSFETVLITLFLFIIIGIFFLCVFYGFSFLSKYSSTILKKPFPKLPKLPKMPKIFKKTTPTPVIPSAPPKSN